MEARGFEYVDADAEREAIERTVAAVEADTTPHVAVVGEPYAGRAALLDHAASLLAENVRVSLTDPVDEPVELPDAPAVVVDDCQYLYTRSVDGFEPLAAFADALVDGDRLFVTGWNRQAWNYLTAVRDVDELFAATVEVPGLSADATEQFLTETHDGSLPEFAESEHPTGHGEDAPALSLPGGRTIPLPAVSLAAVGDALGSDDPDDVRARVFETVADRSGGNPTVAWALWNAAIEDDTVSPARVRASVPEVSLNDADAFTLVVVLTNEEVPADRLESIVGGREYRRSLRRLRQQELVTVTDGRVSIRPAAVPSATAFLSRRRLVW
jgi:hypothetical protein